MPLVSTAEQVYLSGVTNDIGAEDDAGMVRMYCQSFVAPDVRSKSTDSQTAPSDPRVVSELLESIHLVAAAEAIAFARYLNMDLAQFYSLVNNAAGASWMFKNIGAKMMGLSHESSLQSNKSISDAIKKLSVVVQTARDLSCPLYLGNATLNILLNVGRRGWCSHGSESAIKYYEANSV